MPLVEGALWTRKHRQAASLHEVSYRACFKPQLAAWFIERYSAPGDLVHDPFMGRGTTPLEAALRGRRVAGGDVNPLSVVLAAPRLDPPAPEAVFERLESIDWDDAPPLEKGMDLSMFFAPGTLRHILALRNHLLNRGNDAVDRWLRMVATNRLTGHSAGFFSVYTLPPNQAASPDRQRIINLKRGQTPKEKDVKKILFKKTRTLLTRNDPRAMLLLREAAKSARLFTADARKTPLPDDSVTLTVTSPPFMNVVQYASDNWLRCWFNGLDAQEVGARMVTTTGIRKWTAFIADSLKELYRVTKPGGHVAFEVGEILKGRLALEEVVEPLGLQAGFKVAGVVVNRQRFVKTSNIWGIPNNSGGTNSNRIVLLMKPKSRVS